MRCVATGEGAANCGANRESDTGTDHEIPGVGHRGAEINSQDNGQADKHAGERAFGVGARVEGAKEE